MAQPIDPRTPNLIMAADFSALMRANDRFEYARALRSIRLAFGSAAATRLLWHAMRAEIVPARRGQRTGLHVVVHVSIDVKLFRRGNLTDNGKTVRCKVRRDVVQRLISVIQPGPQFRGRRSTRPGHAGLVEERRPARLRVRLGVPPVIVRTRIPPVIVRTRCGRRRGGEGGGKTPTSQKGPSKHAHQRRSHRICVCVCEV